MRPVVCLATTFLVACGADTRPNGAIAGDGGAGMFVGDAGASAANDGCSEAARLVYVVSAQNAIYSFSPATLSFAPIGTLACPASPGATPFSMAVDRNGTAWVNYNDGNLFRVSTKDASCTPTGFVPQGGFKTFGMGFATDTPGGTSESLYLCGYDLTATTQQGRGLGRLDTKTLVVTPVGDFTAPFTRQCGELTGTGDARLFGFFEGSPAQLAGIDKSNATVAITRDLPGVNTSTNSAYAFSFWGGDFWFYSSQGEGFSQVTRYRAASDGAIGTVVPNVGFAIVGAGVSTCAPTVPPK